MDQRERKIYRLIGKTEREGTERERKKERKKDTHVNSIAKFHEELIIAQRNSVASATPARQNVPLPSLWQSHIAMQAAMNAPWL